MQMTPKEEIAQIGEMIEELNAMSYPQAARIVNYVATWVHQSHRESPNVVQEQARSAVVLADTRGP